MAQPSISLSRRTWVRFLIAAYLIVLAGHMTGFFLKNVLQVFYSAGGFIPMFHMDGEGTFPALYSGALIFSCAIMSITIGRLHTTPQSDRLGWTILGTFLAFLAFDEWLGIHENIGFLFEKQVSTSGIFGSGWVIPYSILAILFVGAIAPWLFRQEQKTRINFFVAGLIYVSGAVGLEMAFALVSENYFENEDTLEYATFLIQRSLFVALEESLEIIGMSIFAVALFDVLTGGTRTISISLKEPETNTSTS